MSGNEVVAVSKLTHSQRIIVSQWLTAVLEQGKSSETEPFRVTFDREKITVASSGNEPDNFTNYFHLCMARAELTHAISCRPGKIKVISNSSIRDAAIMTVTDIEVSKLQSLLDSQASSALKTSTEESFATALPELVKRRLTNFEPEMQAYIKSCCANYSKHAVGFYTSNQTPLRIPVLLPNLDMLGHAAECRDLMQILSEPPAGKSSIYRDRYTGKQFRLSELSPAPQSSFTTSPDQAMREHPHTHHAPNGRR